MKELDFALQKATGKSVGPDEIGYPMIKNLPEVGKRALLDAINKEWTEGTFLMNGDKVSLYLYPKVVAQQMP